MQTPAANDIRGPSRSAGPGRRLAALALALPLALATSCDDDGTRPVLPPGALVDVFQQVTVSKVDVLWVVDNSPTMLDKRETVARNFDRFLRFFTNAKTDFHIGITTVDATNDKGKLRFAQGQPAVIAVDTADPVGVFAKNLASLNTGTGSAFEPGLDAARRTFELRPAGFLRDDAYLFIVWVTDEEDESAPGTPKFFYRYFASLKGKGNERMVNAGGIIGLPTDRCAREPGLRYQDVVERLGGRIGSICDEEFDGILRELGADAVGLKRKFALTRVPDLATMELTVKYACDTPRETLDAACVEPPATCGPTDTEILCTPKRKVEGSPDGWDFEPSTNSLVFAGAAIPPKGASVEAIYFEPGKRP